MSPQLPLVALPTAPRCARLFVSDQLRRWHLDELNDTVGLVACELVTNAVAATGTLEMPTGYAALHDLDLAIVAMLLLVARGSLFVEVWDRDPNPPIPTNADDLGESGRGLTLVSALTRAWGVYPGGTQAGGKVVWAAINIPDDLAARIPSDGNHRPPSRSATSRRPPTDEPSFSVGASTIDDLRRG